MTSPVVPSGTDRKMCARCRTIPRVSTMTGCLCEPCEVAIQAMTPAHLDADYATHAATEGQNA